MEITINQITERPNEILYWRKPTKREIKFGYGANHFRDFKFEKCFDKNGFLMLKVKSSDDKLIYYYSGQEYFKTSKAKLNKITI